MDTLDRLQAWYVAQCDGDWEHSYGVCIGTLDNPGWELKVDLTDTSIEEFEYQATETHSSDSDWLVCRVVEGRFESFGGPRNLEAMLHAFLDWVESAEPAERT